MCVCVQITSALLFVVYVFFGNSHIQKLEDSRIAVHGRLRARRRRRRTSSRDGAGPSAGRPQEVE